MPRADVVCLVVPVALVSLALLLSLRRGAWESEAAVIRRLRRRLSGAHELRRVQRRVYEVLQTWQILPLPRGSLSHTDAGAIHLTVLVGEQQPYDDLTLLHVLTHEACHAAGERLHDASFFARQAECLSALVADGLLQPGSPPCPSYPAVILGGGQSAVSI